jgi:hypothetical protein
MATKVKTGVIDSSAITSALIANASITADDLHTTLDLTGKTVTVSTASAGDNDTSVASTAYVDVAIANLADSAPSTLNTLNELAAALGDDANYATTTTAAIAGKLPLAGGTMTGAINAGANNISNINNTSSISFLSTNGYWTGGTQRINGSGDLVNIGTIASGVVTATGTDTQQYRLLQGTAVAGGMFKERTITGTGVSNDVSFFAESISDGGEIHFMTGGSATKRVTIDASGNVGIGTASPDYNTEIEFAAGNHTQGLSITNSQAGGYGSSLYFTSERSDNNAHANAARIFTQGQDSWNSEASADSNLFFATALNGSLNTRMTIKHDGNVGIGTADPYGKLQIEGNTTEWATSPILIFASTSTANAAVRDWAIGPADSNYGDFHILQGASTGASPLSTSNSKLTIRSTGNVGIGTTTPAYALEVNGQVKSAEGLHSNNWQLYNTGTNGFLIGTNIVTSDYAHIYGEIKLQQFNYNTHQIINFSATVGNNSILSSYAAVASDSPVTIKLFNYAGNWYIWVPSPSNYSDISAYIHMGAGYQGTSRGSNAITSLSASGVPSSGVANSVDIIAKIGVPGSVIQTVYAQTASLVTPSQTINDYITLIQVNITPKYATSKILINGIAAVSFSGGNYPAIHARIYRDSTTAKQYQYWGYEGPTNTHRILNEPIHFLDSPTTTSALTYYVKITNTSGSAYTGTYTARGNSYNQSTITVQEIAQ